MRRVLLIIGGVVTAGVFGLALAVDLYGRREHARRVSAIVVLGARVQPDGRPSTVLRARVEKGVELYRKGLAPLLVFSGGVGDHGSSEASVAASLAVELGVPREACLLEQDSHSTTQNAQRTARLLRERGIGEVVLVSDPYHLLRARQNFWREGVLVHTSPADLSERNLRAGHRAYWVLREAFALLAQPGLWWARSPPVERRGTGG